MTIQHTLTGAILLVVKEQTKQYTTVVKSITSHTPAYITVGQVVKVSKASIGITHTIIQ